MTYFLQIIFICTLAKIKEIEMIAIANKQVVVTFHDYDRSWNEAENMCESGGGQLYVEDSIERTKVIEKYISEWNKNTDAWIGLHYPASGTNDTFAWTNCFWLEYTNYKDSAEPKDTNSKKCVMADKNGLGWKTHQCDHNHRFVCERLGDDCLFNRKTGIPTTTADFSAVTMTAVDQDACESKCLVTIDNNRNCWGLNFHSTLDQNNCVLYFTDDPFYFADSAMYDSSAVSMSEKLCYSRALDTTDDTSIAEDNSATPTELCSPYTDQTTTTTAPTTTTTTTAPTTTTAASTTAAPTTTSAAPTTTATAPTTTTAASTTTSAASTTTTAASTTTTAATITTAAASTTTTVASTTTRTTTDALTSTSSSCTCECSDLSKFIGNYRSDPTWLNMTTEEKVAQLVVKLRIDKTKVSANVRKKTSAQDNSVVSKSVGYVALVFMCVLFGLIIVSDGVKSVKFIAQKRLLSSKPVYNLEEEDSAL